MKKIIEAFDYYKYIILILIINIFLTSTMLLIPKSDYYNYINSKTNLEECNSNLIDSKSKICVIEFEKEIKLKDNKLKNENYKEEIPSKKLYDYISNINKATQLFFVFGLGLLIGKKYKKESIFKSSSYVFTLLISIGIIFLINIEFVLFNSYMSSEDVLRISFELIFIFISIFVGKKV